MRLQQVFRQDQIFHSQSLDVDVERIFGDIRQVVPNFFFGWMQEPGYVWQDPTSGLWQELRRTDEEPAVERFPGDHLDKWFLSDILSRLEQIIGHNGEHIPPLCVTQRTRLVLREQRRVLTASSPRTTQLLRAFSE